MPHAPLRLDTDSRTRIRAGLRALRARLELPSGFTPDVLAAAESALDLGLRDGRARRDLTDVELVTIDPTGSTDLDQAVWIGDRPGAGLRVLYAIADVAAFVNPGDVIDAEARRRGVTVYLPDGRVPLHPEALSEHAASLRAGQDRPALVWDISVDADGAVLDAHLERAVVRSRAELDYVTVQRRLDAGTAEAPLVALRELGRRREELEARRGGVSLPLPDQEIVVGADGRMGLTFRHPLPVEGWNAQVSLLAGMAAARIMLDARVGVLRTLPAPGERTLRELRSEAAALGVPWPAGTAYPDVVRGLDPERPNHTAFAAQAARLFRGAGYLAFDGQDVPSVEDAVHAAVAAPYAHVTAPLRRLVDRHANEVVLSACAGIEPPDDVRAVLADLPTLMSTARRRESAADGGARDLVEQVLLADRSGEPLHAVVIGVDDHGVRLQLADPAVLARIEDDRSERQVTLGEQVVVRADGSGSLQFSD